MRIGELSKRTGISQRMLRYYEEEGLLHPNRSVSGYREYNQASEAVARHIRNLSEAGIKLSNIKVLLPCLLEQGTQPRFVGCAAVKATLEEELDKLESKLHDLTISRDAIRLYLNGLLPDTDD